MSIRAIFAALVLSVFMVYPIASSASDDDASAPHEEATVVHLSHFTDNLHAAFMAIKLAGAIQATGEKTVLFVDLEGVGAADSRQPNDLRWGHSDALNTYYDAFVKAGGTVLVCPHCAKAAGLSPADVRPGAKIATEQELVSTLADSERILDY